MGSPLEASRKLPISRADSDRRDHRGQRLGATGEGVAGEQRQHDPEVEEHADGRREHEQRTDLGVAPRIGETLEEVVSVATTSLQRRRGSE